MNHLTWSKTEKLVAKTAFEKAYRKECEAIVQELKGNVASVKEPGDLWHVLDFLTKKRNEIERKYDYRYSVLIFVLATLLKEGWLRETDLKGLNEDKLQTIGFLTNPEKFRDST